MSEQERQKLWQYVQILRALAEVRQLAEAKK